MAGPEFTAKYQTLIYLAGSASAEFIADIALCPFEAVKARTASHAACCAACSPRFPRQVKVQTNPTWAKGLADGLPKFVATEGYGGCVSGGPA